MEAWKQNNRGLRLFFVLAVVVHLGFLLLPLTKKMAEPVDERSAVRVQLISNPVVVEQQQAPEPVEERLDPVTRALEKLPPAPLVQGDPTGREVVQQQPSRNSRRVLSSQFEFEKAGRESLFGSVEQTDDVPDFYFRQRASLEMVLNQPSLQLPFEDRRIYLVNSYDDGIMGGIDRFWDTVSVPFGFTTRNNTRVQCVWVLVIAGCGWGHKTLFHRPARLREKLDEHSLENTEVVKQGPV